MPRNVRALGLACVASPDEGHEHWIVASALQYTSGNCRLKAIQTKEGSLMSTANCKNPRKRCSCTNCQCLPSNSSKGTKNNKKLRPEDCLVRLNNHQLHKVSWPWPWWTTSTVTPPFARTPHAVRYAAMQWCGWKFLPPHPPTPWSHRAVL